MTFAITAVSPPCRAEDGWDLCRFMVRFNFYNVNWPGIKEGDLICLAQGKNVLHYCAERELNEEPLHCGDDAIKTDLGDPIYRN